MHPDSAFVLEGYGAEAGDFVARQFDAAMAAEADLVLAMTRSHRRDVLHAAPRALARTFTLREAADLLGLVGDVALGGGEFLERGRDLVARMAAARSRRQGSQDDDIRDPIGLPVEAHDEAGAAIVEALLPILRRLADLTGPIPA